METLYAAAQQVIGYFYWLIGRGRRYLYAFRR